MVRTASTSRTWGLAGIVAAVAALAGMVASAGVTSGAQPEDFRDPAVLLPRLVEGRTWVLVFQAAMTVAALALVVFAAGLRRHLSEQEPAGSLTPTVAAGGLGLVAALCLVGAGLGTELWWALGHPDEAGPASVASMVDLVATLSWVWAGAGLAAAAVAVAALRHGALPRWMGWVSVAGAVVTLGISLVPLQYLSGVFGALWLLAVAIGVSARRGRVA
jgi:hypothetical protein